MLAKNLPLRQAIWKIPLRILLDAISACKSLFAGEATYFIAVIKAHGGFLKWFFKARKSHSGIEKGRYLYGFYSRSIIWDHFVAGRNSFTEIIHSKR